MNVPLQANPDSLSLVDKVTWSTEWIQRMKGQIFALQNGGAVAGVSSVFGRTGNVVAQSGDYPFAFISSLPTTIAGYGITDGVSTSGSYADPAWITSLAWSKITSTPTTLSGYGITDAIPLSQKAANSGVASLDVTGKVPLAQLPTLPSQYKGAWNAATNTPTLLNTSGGTAGDFYIVSTSGSTNFGAGSITFAINDEVVFGTIWQKIPTSGTQQQPSDWNAISGVTAIANKPTTFSALGVQMNTNVLLGRSGPVAGPPQEITVTAPLTLSGFNLSISGSTTTLDTLGAATLATITYAASITFNGNNGTIQQLTMTGNATLTISNLKVGIPYTFLVAQDVTGNRVITWPTVKVAYHQLGAPPQSIIGGAIDKYTFTYTGTAIYVDSGLRYD